MTKFTLIDIDEKPDIKEIANIITTGSSNGAVLYIIRNFVDKKICEKVCKKFQDIVSNLGHSRDSDDFVKTEQLGASQFHKTGRAYIDSVIQNGNLVSQLFDGLDDSVLSNLFLDQQLEQHFAKESLNYRAARYHTHNASFCTTRRWLNNGQMSLHPHEDSAQLQFAKIDNFEIHSANDVIAVNL